MTSPGVSTRIAWKDLPRFSGEHFHVWKSKISLILQLEGLMGIMEGTEVRPSTPPGSTTRTPESGAGSKQEWDVKNLMALAVLSDLLKDHQHPLIARHSTAAEAWAELF